MVSQLYEMAMSAIGAYRVIAVIFLFPFST